ECQQLAFAPRQDRHRALGCTTSGDATVPRTRQALLAKNAQVDRLGFWCGFDPELVTETFPKLPVRGDGQSRPPRGGVGLHQQAQRGLVVWTALKHSCGEIRGGCDIPTTQCSPRGS